MYPTRDPRDPASISRWEKSQYNIHRSKVEVVDLRCFRDKMTRRGRTQAKPVPVEMCYALDAGIADEQRIALKRFQETESELYARARIAIYDWYRETYAHTKEKMTSIASILKMVPTQFPDFPARSGETASEYQAKIRKAIEDQILKAQRGEVDSWASLASMMFAGGAGMPPLMPKIEKGNELDRLVSFGRISVLRPQKGLSRIGVVLRCSWNEEDGMGLLIAGDEIECVGDAGVVDLAVLEPTRRKKPKG